MTKAVDATLRVADKELTFPGVDAVEGNDGLGVSSLLKETGLEIKVPSHINIGDKVRVSTTTGEFLVRVND